MVADLTRRGDEKKTSIQNQEGGYSGDRTSIARGVDRFPKKRHNSVAIGPHPCCHSQKGENRRLHCFASFVEPEEIVFISKKKA